MSYQILGRAIKNEHLALGVLVSTFGGAYLATRGGSSDAAKKPASVQQAKASVPINAGSSEEEKFIQNFIAEAEKEGAAAAKH
ncbi:hypothetical protein BDQ12DRAFT_683967 [Crucibulum laeve]|uniref:ATP synthase subunit K, mitochondrial n=1 Tax=Crucibulum laeve TaxID=68775 RepID=A0A5C3M199_9AGAR|nr:hypothetical protein BDQ12DRAFT_683967 [Crucibulum laeve]